jgi:KTSC domain
MERKPVESSQLVSVGYDPKTSTLEIEFRSGSTYQYFDVLPETHEALINAKTPEGGSVGRYFGQQIRGKFKFQKLPPPEKAEGASE